MRTKMGFLMLLIGGAGLDGPESAACAVVAVIGLMICLKESKKIDAPRPKRTSIK